MSERTRTILSSILRILLGIILIFLFTKIWKYILPFIIAYFFASVIEPLVKFIERKLKIPRKIGSVFSILFVLGTIGSIIGLLISRLIKEIRNVYLSLELDMETLTRFFESIIQKLDGFFVKFPTIHFTDLIDKAIEELTNNLQTVLGRIINWAQASIQIALSLPQILIFILVTILATYFMSSDKNNIMRFLDLQIPANWLNKTKNITQNVFSAFFGWLRAQLILTSITFTELLIGLLILRINNALLIALLIALVDVLPILGAGTVLVPWAIITLLLGDTKLALSLALLYLIILLVRQLIEPKVLGKQIGVHPLFTLAGMYIGLKIWKVPGMFIGPLCIVAFKYIFEGVAKADSFKNWIAHNFPNKNKGVSLTNASGKESDTISVEKDA